MEDCIFCKIVNKQIPSYIVYEDEWTLAFLDAFPNSVGHTLVIPKKHYQDLLSTDADILQKVNETRQKVAKLLFDKLSPKGINFCSNNGEEAFQVVFHYHEHIIPKYKKEFGFTYKLNKDGSEQKDFKEVLNIILK